MKKIINQFLLPFFYLGALLVAGNLYAEEINDAVALNGVTKTKSVFLIDFTNAKKTAFYLEIIQGTYTRTGETKSQPRNGTSFHWSNG